MFQVAAIVTGVLVVLVLTAIVWFENRVGPSHKVVEPSEAKSAVVNISPHVIHIVDVDGDAFACMTVKVRAVASSGNEVIIETDTSDSYTRLAASCDSEAASWVARISNAMEKLQQTNQAA